MAAVPSGGFSKDVFYSFVNTISEDVLSNIFTWNNGLKNGEPFWGNSELSEEAAQFLEQYNLHAAKVEAELQEAGAGDKIN